LPENVHLPTTIDNCLFKLDFPSAYAEVDSLERNEALTTSAAVLAFATTRGMLEKTDERG
jgi:hypothetical protein